MSAAKRTPGGRSRWRTLTRALIASVLVGFVVIVIVGVVLYRRVTAEPVWWTPDLATDTRAAVLAEEAEKGMTRVLSREREPGEAWTIELTEEQANAWLATRLERWARSQHTNWPTEVRGVRIDFRDHAVTIGVAVDAGGATRYASITAEPGVADRSRVVLRLISAKVGVQSVPISTLRSYADELVPDGVVPAEVMRVIQEGEIELPESFVLDESRRVSITGVTVQEDRLLVICELGSP